MAPKNRFKSPVDSDYSDANDDVAPRTYALRNGTSSPVRASPRGAGGAPAANGGTPVAAAAPRKVVVKRPAGGGGPKKVKKAGVAKSGKGAKAGNNKGAKGSTNPDGTAAAADDDLSSLSSLSSRSPSPAVDEDEELELEVEQESGSSDEYQDSASNASDGNDDDDASDFSDDEIVKSSKKKPAPAVIPKVIIAPAAPATQSPAFKGPSRVQALLNANAGGPGDRILFNPFDKKTEFEPEPAPTLEKMVEDADKLIFVMRVEATKEETLQIRSQKEIEQSLTRLPTKRHRSLMVLVMNRYSSWCASSAVDIPSFPITATKVAMFLMRAPNTPLADKLLDKFPQPSTFPLPCVPRDGPKGIHRSYAVTDKYEGKMVTRELVKSWSEALAYSQVATRSVWDNVLAAQGSQSPDGSTLMTSTFVDELLGQFESEISLINSNQQAAMRSMTAIHPHTLQVNPSQSPAGPAPALPGAPAQSTSSAVPQKRRNSFSNEENAATKAGAEETPPKGNATKWTRGGRVVDAPSARSSPPGSGKEQDDLPTTLPPKPPMHRAATDPTGSHVHAPVTSLVSINGGSILQSADPIAGDHWLPPRGADPLPSTSESPYAAPEKKHKSSHHHHKSHHSSSHGQHRSHHHKESNSSRGPVPVYPSSGPAGSPFLQMGHALGGPTGTPAPTAYTTMRYVSPNDGSVQYYAVPVQAAQGGFPMATLPGSSSDLSGLLNAASVASGQGSQFPMMSWHPPSMAGAGAAHIAGFPGAMSSSNGATSSALPMSLPAGFHAPPGVAYYHPSMQPISAGAPPPGMQAFPAGGFMAIPGGGEKGVDGDKSPQSAGTQQMMMAYGIIPSGMPAGSPSMDHGIFANGQMRTSTAPSPSGSPKGTSGIKRIWEPLGSIAEGAATEEYDPHARPTLGRLITGPQQQNGGVGGSQAGHPVVADEETAVEAMTGLSAGGSGQTSNGLDKGKGKEVVPETTSIESAFTMQSGLVV